jgi:hypothetical protein
MTVIRALYAGVVLAATLAHVQVAAQNTPATVQQSGELPETWLEGRIGGNAAIRMFLETSGYPKENGLWGMYYYTRDWIPIPLEGERLASGRIRLYEGDPGRNVGTRARFDLDVSDAAATATWTSADGTRTLPVDLRRVARPASYEAALKSARRFGDRRWPIELAYPTGWFLEVTGTKLVVRSPDPRDMLLGNVLECERGRGLPGMPGMGAPAEHFRGSYFYTRTGWQVEGSPGPGAECKSESCRAPKTRRSGSVLLMSAEIAYRSYNPWGYAGIADAREHLVIEGSEWVHCFDRLLDSEDRIQPGNPSRR